MRRLCVLAVWSAAVLFGGCGGPVASPIASPIGTESAPATASGPGALDSAAPSDPAASLADRVEAEIPVEGSPDWPLAAFDSVWVIAPDLPLHDKGEPHLVRIDPTTNEIVGHGPAVGPAVSGLHGIRRRHLGLCLGRSCASRPGDERDHRQVPIKGVQGFYRPPLVVAWSGRSAAHRSRATPSSGSIPRRWQTTSFPVQGSVAGLAYGFGALWLAMPAEGTVVRSIRRPATTEWQLPDWSRHVPSPSEPTACGCRSTAAATTRPCPATPRSPGSTPPVARCLPRSRSVARRSSASSSGPTRTAS